MVHSSAVRPRAWPRRVGAVGRGRSPEPLEGVPGERPDWHGLAGVADGARDGRDGHRGRHPRPARLVEVPDVGGAARVVERPVVEPPRAVANRLSSTLARSPACYAPSTCSTMFDTLSVARELTATGMEREQADVLADAIGRAAVHGDHVTPEILRGLWLAGSGPECQYF